MSEAVPSAAASAPHAVSQRTQTIGMVIFLLSLVVLFFATMLVYVLGRLFLGQDQPDLGYLRPALTSKSYYVLFLSTAVVLAASATIHFASRAIARERRPAFLKWLWVTNALAVLFVILQVPPMVTIMSFHEGNMAENLANPNRFFGFLVVLILLHAAHVVGGIVYLAMVTVKAHRGGYDHENYRGVFHAALYWHFLDVVWLVMFGTLLLLG